MTVFTTLFGTHRLPDDRDDRLPMPGRPDGTRTVRRPRRLGR